MSCLERREFAEHQLPSLKTPFLGSSLPWHIPGCRGGVKGLPGVGMGGWRRLHPQNSSPVSEELGQLLGSNHQRGETGMEQGNEEIPNSPQMKNSGERGFWQMKQFPMAAF